MKETFTCRFYVRFVALLILLSGTLNAQVTYYNFSQFQGTYTPLANPVILQTATATSGAAAIDDTIFTLPIPFTFTFDNKPYTLLSLSSNGFVTFGGAAPLKNGSATGYTPLSAITAYTGCASAFGRNLAGNFIAGGNANGELSYGILGSAPNREMVFQFKNFRGGSSANSTTPYINFQIRLQESSNRIRFVYNILSGVPTQAAQVGLRGSSSVFSNNDVANRTVSNGLNTWPTSIPGTDNLATCGVGGTFVPPSGMTYEYVVSCPWPTQLGYSNSTSSSTTLTWKGAGGPYEVEYGPVGFTPGTGTILNSTDTFITITNLPSLATRSFYVRTNCTAAGNGYSVRTGPATFKTGTTGEDCASAVSVSVASSPASATPVVVTSGVSANGPNALCSDVTGKTGSTDTWLKFVAPANNKKITLFTSAGTVQDWVMEVWSGCPGSPGSTVIGCSDDANVNMPEISICQNQYVAGQTYYVRAWTYSPTASGTMNLSIYENGQCVIPPAYDECVNAVTIPLHPPLSCPGAAQTFTTQFATVSGSPTTSCDNTSTIRDVWLKFNTGNAGTFKINLTPGTATSLKAAIVFECGSFEVACWDPANGPYVAVGLNPSADYLLRVWSATDLTTGTFSVCLEDVCDDATAAISGNASICAGGSANLRVDLTGIAPWTFQWTNGSTTQTVTTSVTPYFISVSPTVSTSYNLVSLSSAVCAGSVMGTASVSIIPPPTVTLATFPNVCSNVNYTLVEGSPAGGTYSGTAVIGKTFYAPQVGPGSYQITYTAGTGSGCQRSATGTITVIPAPGISSFNPTIAPVGSTVTITGTNFAAGSTVAFNGVQSASVTFVSATQLNAVVPAGATTGTISVTRPNGCTTTSSGVFGVGATPVQINLNLKFFIQGYYIGGGMMNPVLDPASPLLCDSVTVQLRPALNPAVVSYTRNGVLHTNGSITFQYPSSAGNTSYYIVLRHRSSMETWSKNPVFFPTGGSVNFDFTVPAP